MDLNTLGQIASIIAAGASLYLVVQDVRPRWQARKRLRLDIAVTAPDGRYLQARASLVNLSDAPATVVALVFRLGEREYTARDERIVVGARGVVTLNNVSSVWVEEARAMVPLTKLGVADLSFAAIADRSFALYAVDSFGHKHFADQVTMQAFITQAQLLEARQRNQ